MWDWLFLGSIACSLDKMSRNQMTPQERRAKEAQDAYIGKVFAFLGTAIWLASVIYLVYFLVTNYFC